MLTTFVKPTPNTTLIRCLEPINRLFNLRGVPILRNIPGLKRVPGIAGLTNILEIDFPDADLNRLRAAANQETATFLSPNHPEFFTDWMIDKEVISKLDITPGCWATHKIVNGMGKWGQKFWLANNLIAQIPGEAGGAGKEHSITLAKHGDGVLLHPEGAVHWTCDQIGPLYPGVFDMASRTADELAAEGSSRPVYIAPLIYRYMFLKDEHRNLHRALSYVERALNPSADQPAGCLATRIAALYSHLTNQVAAHHGIDLPATNFWDRQAALITLLTHQLAQAFDCPAPGTSDPYQAATFTLRHFDRARRIKGQSQQFKLTVQAANHLRKLLRFQPWMYPAPELSQEHIAECIQRLRLDWLSTRFRDKLHAFIPKPVGPRRAYIRTLDPLLISAHSKDLDPARLRSLMQSRLNMLNKEIAPMQAGTRFHNPFLE